MTLHVLVVDDNPDHRFLTRRALKSLQPELDIQAETADGGPAAFARLDDEEKPPIDLVLLDMKMPGMDGIEVLERLRQDPRHAKLPIIVFSSTEQKTDRTKAIAAGADDVVTKPIGGERFHACIQDTLRAWAAKQTRRP